MPNQSTFYFAWVSGTEDTFSEVHEREDELIFAFELRHEESEFAELELEIINPHIGMLAPGRPLWAWFAWNDGTTTHPLFFGRLFAIPDDLIMDVIKIKLIARPFDYRQQLLALAETMKVLPFYDPLFIDEGKLSDPDVVLEGYSKLWHVDRITHVVTASDIIAGEDGVVEFTPSDVFYDGVKVRIAGSPMLVCEVEAEINWVQCDHTGVFEFKTQPNLVAATTNLGDGYNAESGLGNMSAAGMLSGRGGGGGGGFTVKEATQTTNSWHVKNQEPGPHKDGDLMEESFSRTQPFYGGELINKSESHTFPDPETGQGEEYSISETYKDEYHKPPSGGGGGGGGAADPDSDTNNMIVSTELEQDRTETIRVRVLADVQPVLVEATEDDEIKEVISLNARDPVQHGFGTASDGVYFSMARGYTSVEYMLMIARANLLAGSRVFETEIECPMQKIIGMSCRKNANIEDQRLPGGSVLGKVVSYGIVGNGDDGEFIGMVTTKSAVGNGNAIVTAAGEPDYVDEDYVEPDYQHYTGQLVAAITNDMAWEPLAYVPSGISLPISADQLMVRHEYNDSGRDAIIEQLLASAAELERNWVYPGYGGQMLGGVPDEMMDQDRRMNELDDAINRAYLDFPSWVELEFKPIQNILTHTSYTVEVAALVIPKQVDLAAASTP